MADYIIATEGDAASIGGSTTSSSTMGCTKARAVSLGCALHSPSSGYSDNELVRKADLYKQTYTWSLTNQLLYFRPGHVTGQHYLRSFKVFFVSTPTNVVFYVYKDKNYSNLVSWQRLGTTVTGSAQGDTHQMYYWDSSIVYQSKTYKSLLHNAHYTSGGAQVPSNPTGGYEMISTPVSLGSSTLSYYLYLTNCIPYLLSYYNNGYNSLYARSERTTGIGLSNRWTTFDMYNSSPMNVSLPEATYDGQQYTAMLAASYVFTDTQSGSSEDINVGFYYLGEVTWTAHADAWV